MSHLINDLEDLGDDGFPVSHPAKCRCSMCVAAWDRVNETLSHAVIPPAPDETHH